MDDYLKSTMFFDATQFPDIKFFNSGIEWIDETTALPRGVLTPHGATRALVFNVHMHTTESCCIEKNLEMTMHDNAEIQRPEFGMNAQPPFVSDTARLRLIIEASRVGSQI